MFKVEITHFDINVPRAHSNFTLFEFLEHILIVDSSYQKLHFRERKYLHQ